MFCGNRLRQADGSTPANKSSPSSASARALVRCETHVYAVSEAEQQSITAAIAADRNYWPKAKREGAGYCLQKGAEVIRTTTGEKGVISDFSFGTALDDMHAVLYNVDSTTPGKLAPVLGVIEARILKVKTAADDSRRRSQGGK